MNKKLTRAIADTGLMILLLVFPHLSLLPMYLFTVLLLIMWLYLKIFKENFSNIGFVFSEINFRSLYIGGAIGIAYAMFSYWFLGPLVDWLGFKQANLSDFNYIRHNPFNYLFLLIIACFIAIPFEELVFRGFILTRVKAMIPGKWAFVISGLITSILFALYHYQEGTGAIITIFIFSLFITYLYRLFGGRLWYLIFFHIFYDLFMLTAIFLGYM